MKSKTLFTVIILITSAITGAYAQKSERGIAKAGKNAPVVVEKGTWMFGGSVRGSYFNGNNYSMAVLDGINTDGYTVDVHPAFMYMIRDNIGIGVRGSYKRGLFDLPQAQTSFTIGDDPISIEDLQSLRQSGGGSVFVRYFIPIGASGRFSIIGDFIVGGEAGTSKFSKRKDLAELGTYQSHWKFGADVDFGMMAFITKNLAVEAELGVFGFGMTGSSSVKNQVYEGSYSSFKPYFDINFLSLSVGAFLYF